MNCEQFRCNLQRALDARIDLSDSNELRVHADECANCRLDWMVAKNISGDCIALARDGSEDGLTNSAPSHLKVAPIDDGARMSSDQTCRRAHSKTAERSRLGLCAASLFAVVLGYTVISSTWRQDSPATARVDASSKWTDASKAQRTPTGRHETRAMPGTTSHERWNDTDGFLSSWPPIQPRAWVDDTMPAIQSFRQSMAPVGRSLIKAAALLTTSPRGETT